MTVQYKLSKNMSFLCLEVKGHVGGREDPYTDYAFHRNKQFSFRK